MGQVDENEVYVRVQTLCESLGRNPIPVVTVTAQPEFQHDKDNEEVLTEFRKFFYGLLIRVCIKNQKFLNQVISG